MQVTSTTPFSLNSSLKEFPTSKKGLETLSQAELISIVIDQNQQLCAERVIKGPFREACTQTAEKVRSVFDKTVEAYHKKRQFALGERKKMYDECITEGRKLAEEAKLLKDEAVVKGAKSEVEDQLLTQMYLLPVQMFELEADFTKSQNYERVIAKMGSFQVELAKLRAELKETMKQAKHDFEKLQDNTLIADFDKIKKKIGIYEKLTDQLVKEEEIMISELLDPGKKSAHLKTILLNDKTEEYALRNRISGELSKVKREVLAHIAEMKSTLSSLKKGATSYGNEINLYLSGIERKTFATSSLPSFLGGTTTKQFVSL